MAKTPTKKKKPSKHSTKPTVPSVKVTSKRKSRVADEPIVVVPPEGCACCAGLESGGVFTCEDGVALYIPPQPYKALLYRDPDTHGGLPYWERPANIPNM